MSVAVNGLAVLSNQQTMSSIDLREIINAERMSSKEPAVENSHFLKRIEDELDDLGIRKVFVNPEGGRPSAYYSLTMDQCLLVGMRESKAVRRNVLAKLKEMQPPVKQLTYSEALRQLADEVEAKELAQIERDRAIETKAEIGHRREATAMNTASQAVKQRNALQVELDQSLEWASVKLMQMKTGLKFNWRLLKSAGQDLGIDTKDVFDANYGTVKAYHRDVWQEAYALDISR